jgi:drug/metabolite transporter (DMT)-like permease
LINYLWPAFTVLLSVPVLGVRASWGLLPGTAVALVGVFLLLGGGETGNWHSWLSTLASNPLAFGLAFAAALMWGLYSNLTRRWAGAAARGAAPLFVLASGVVLLLARLVYTEPGHWTARTACEVGFLGLSVVAAYTCWDAAMRRGNIVLVSAAAYLTPLLAALVSCLYLRVTPRAEFWIGCLCLVAGSWASWRSIAVKPDRR